MLCGLVQRPSRTIILLHTIPRGGLPVRTRLLSLALLALGIALPAACAADKVTLDDLLKQMTDLSKLAEYPDPPYVTKQFSSYDRASEAPGNDAWFANSDRGFPLYDGVVKDKTPYFKTGPMQMSGPDGTFAAGTKVGLAPTHKPIGNYVWAYATGPDGGPIDGKIPQGYIDKAAFTPDPQGHVLAEMDGPGCVVRIWSANPDDAGKIHIYLDDAKDPVIEAPLTELLGGKWKTTIDGKETTPFTDPIACERSRGFNLYFPIAYAKHCKITIDKPDIYYHVDYRTYAKGTEVETFGLATLVGKSERVNEAIVTLKGARRIDIDKEANGFGQDLKPAARLKVPFDKEQFDGPGVVKRLKVSCRNDDSAAETLRNLVLIGTFDGAAKPQIWCPVGDFFASSPGVNAYRTLPFDVTLTGDAKSVELAAWWPMPYEKSAVFELLYVGKQPQVWVDMHVMAGKYQWTDRSMHFHAKWRTADMKTRPFHDWTYCDLKGKGVFVGDMLSVMNPVGAWWGEGDEKIFVDGEKFPSWFGTGSEDYYGYAWSDPTPFQHPYHNQTRCDGKGTGATLGLTSVNRFHILDNIPFEKSFRFDMECWHWKPDVTVNYAATSYWYSRPGATDDFEPVDAKVLQTIPAPPPPPPPFKVEGALEGESLKILGKSSEFALDAQDMHPFSEGKWSGESQLWGRPAKAGEFADLVLPVAADGKYQVIVYLTKARDYGIVQASLDGAKLGKPIDCFEPDKVLATGPIDLGAVELKKGQAVLRLEVTGTNEKSVGLRYMFGLDCVVLKPAGS
jgi:hypothetical protein